jgi:membrane associated rhomboid family serine protease
LPGYAVGREGPAVSEAEPPRRRRDTPGDGGRRSRLTWESLPSPTVGEAATLVSVPLLLLAVHFVVRPAVTAWSKLGYVRYPVARAASADLIAPDPLTGVAGAWHGITRLTHALVHDPSGVHGHALGNAALIATAGAVLLTVLAALGWRRWFVYFYWELAVVGPVVGSYAFDLFGRTEYGYGASAAGFAFLGALWVLGSVVVVRSRRNGSAGDGRAGRVAVGILLVLVGATVGTDLVVASPAAAVHVAGFCFGVLVGTVGVPLLDR